jgi:hypothetical protein
MNLDSLLKSDFPKRLIDRLWQVQAGVNDGTALRKFRKHVRPRVGSLRHITPAAA